MPSHDGCGLGLDKVLYRERTVRVECSLINAQGEGEVEKGIARDIESATCQQPQRDILHMQAQ